MNGPSRDPFVESVLHATDFSEASDVAFAHALAIALVREASFTLLHAGDRVAENWRRFPEVRRTLERWELLEAGSSKQAVFERLSVAVTKIDASGSPVRAAADVVADEDIDLVVVATEGRDGLSRFLRPSKAQGIARRTGSMTLFVPTGCRPFVSFDDGTLSLRRVLVPVAHTPSADGALRMATRIAKGWGEPPVRITHLHVGERAPKLPTLTDDQAWSWQGERRGGDVIAEIVTAARDADLVVMPTDGRDGPFDLFRGSHTERVVRAVDCPLLSVPSA